MSPNTYNLIQLELDQAIARITLNRPPVNALNRALLAEFSHALTAIETNDDLRVIVITGAGNLAFCAGADVAEFMGLDSLGAHRLLMEFASAFEKLEKLSIPVIAAINGLAFGGGCELAMACDIRIAAHNASFSLPELRIGVIPAAGGTQRLPRLIPRGRAKHLIFTGERIHAEEAERIGLVDRLAPEREALDAAMALAHRLCGQSPVALQLAKRAMSQGTDLPLQQALTLERELGAQCFMTNDLKEGVAAFFEKRPPAFVGR